MATSTAVAYQFMPWVRRGLSVALTASDTLGVGPLLPARATAQINVALAAPHAGTAIDPLALQLHGPGDVIGIDARLVLRTDPKPQARNFEPNYLAIVDFDPPDFPWMLTPALAHADDRLRPWLVLLVLEKSKVGTPKMPPQGPLPTVRIAAADVATELPPLAESWSWAHAQVVSHRDDAPGIQSDLQADPTRNASRLVCPRRLLPLTDYVACVVPAFEPGRLRGLGLAEAQPAAMATLGPAWDVQQAADVLLPVYYHWEFSTGPGGDFESLARRLKTPNAYTGNAEVAALLSRVGTAPMGVDPVLTSFVQGAVATMEGALVPISYTPGSAPDPTQAESLALIVNTPQANVADPVADGPTNAAGRRIEVKPDMVGGWHAKKHQVALAEIPSHWVAGLNLNPRYRGAAGYGAEVVRQNQEIFMDAAWGQIGRIQDAEMRFNLTRLAIEGQRALKAKHFDTLPPERLLQVMGPALGRIEAQVVNGTAYRIGNVAGSVGGQIARTSLPSALTDTAMRRATTPQRRSLRMAARLNANLPALAGQTRRYVGAMAAATQRSAAFTVNAFLPDGIVGSKALDALNLDGAADRLLDLRNIGLGQTTVGQVRDLQTAAKGFETALAQRGMPGLQIRAGQHLGVFTDLHVERFSQLASAMPTVQSTDWGVVARTVESLGHRGVEGVLVEAHAAADNQQASLQFSTLKLDARSGSLRLNRALVRELDTARRDVTPPVRKGVAARAVVGASLGSLRIADGRKYSTAGVFAALPLNAVQSVVADAEKPHFSVNTGFEIVGSLAAQPNLTVATLTLPPALRQRDILNRYAVATRGSQQLWKDGFVQSQVQVQPVDFSLAAARSAITAATQPDTTLRARLASTVSVAHLAATEGNAFVSACLSITDAFARQRFMVPALFDRVMAWPTLPEPLYQRLSRWNPNAFMPGVDGIPQDLVMLAKVNQHFIDSFMAGANCEMNRELLWRGFPTDLRGTPFQRFWDRSSIGPAPTYTYTPLDDIQPIHQWGAQPLGLRSDQVSPFIRNAQNKRINPVVLLVRGQLLRRYPNTAVYAWKKTAGADSLQKDAQGLRPDGALATPRFSGTVGVDISFFGFDIDAAEADQWCFVLEEQMTEPRFGFDVDEPAPGQARTGPPRRNALQTALATPLYSQYNSYKALSWSHLAVPPGGFVTLAGLRQAPPSAFTGFPMLTASANAAEIARALLQQPFRAYFVGADLKT
ncbi:MAG: hypothetical protein ABI410_21005 [Rhodoferax sp.]|uniref:hypothetical protein n=1 Tax=Rhodoferax sp. TaxID=50421 RepID=UPI0032652624